MLLKSLFPVWDGVYAIDTIRSAAIVLVVLYHVIGAGPGSGLELAPPHPLRSLADILNEVHMPIFAAMSGLVYAMKPPGRSTLLPFLRKKLVRLAVPGLVATSLFAVAVQSVGTGFALPSPLWHLVVYPFLHFWFLQSLLVILAVAAITDAVTRGRSAWIMLPLGLAVLHSGMAPPSDVMAVNGAIWLMPYFALGQFLWRLRDRVIARKGLVCIGVAAGIAVGLGVDLLQIGATGSVDPRHSAPDNILFSAAVCLAIALIPPLGWVAWLAAPSFVIYLYHPLATSAARRVLHAVEVESLAVHAAVGVMAGVAAPLALYVAAMQHGLGKLLLLGQGSAGWVIKLPKEAKSY